MRKSMLAGFLALTLVLSGCAGKGDASASGSGSGNASGSASGSEPVNVPTAEEVQTARRTPWRACGPPGPFPALRRF